MSDIYHGDYYSCNSRERYTDKVTPLQKDISKWKHKIGLLITKGLSSVQIAEVLELSYPTVNRYTKLLLPNKVEQLRLNGRNRQIRKPNDKAS